MLSGSRVCVGVVEGLGVDMFSDEGGGMGEGACLSLALLDPCVSNRLLSILRVARWGASQWRQTCGWQMDIVICFLLHVKRKQLKNKKRNVKNAFINCSKQQTISRGNICFSKFLFNIKEDSSRMNKLEKLYCPHEDRQKLNSEWSVLVKRAASSSSYVLSGGGTHLSVQLEIGGHVRITQEREPFLQRLVGHLGGGRLAYPHDAVPQDPLDGGVSTKPAELHKII